ncbi:hypothetical protein C2G38_2038730 [Gigaspora rosea]|uniref:Uncharacterized protein n=1 Tax=Gigaspora rosea TaxID=44941 RepID=A0A397V3N7_9GLOM|nr:hypothetical protein C2G38_2038730 [Gigaspora rosea]
MACNLSDKASKEELSERLHAYFEKRKGKQPSTFVKKTVSETNSDNKNPKMDTGIDYGDDFDAEGFVDLEGDDIDVELQEADGKIREKFAARFPGKRKVESVPVNIFLSTLSNLEKKLNKSFSALNSEIEEREALDAAWLKPRSESDWTELSECYLVLSGKILWILKMKWKLMP